MEIKYIEARTGQMKTEKVYGKGAVKWLYGTLSGQLANSFITSRLISRIYGKIQDSAWSRTKVVPFIENFNIDMSEFEKEEGCRQDEPFSSFNQFFIRKFKAGKRPFEADLKKMPAPCEARYFGWDSIGDDITLPVKGSFLKAKDLLGKGEWGEVFHEGPGFIARLCPVDYHRFHFPDTGSVTDHYRIKGPLDSVNPLALKKKGEIFIQNERYVSILETQNFGKLAYIEVGATCVGKIVQSTDLTAFKRGHEKGYFLFGGSTVIVLGEKGKFKLSESLVENTQKGIETYYRLGESLC